MVELVLCYASHRPVWTMVVTVCGGTDGSCAVWRYVRAKLGWLAADRAQAGQAQLTKYGPEPGA